MTDTQKEILLTCYSQKRIGVIKTLPDFKDICDELMLRISVITGWNLHDDVALEILLQEFRLWLVNNYSDANMPEIIAAVRMFGVGKKDWGKKINLTMIAECVAPYLNERRNAHEILERSRIKKSVEQLKPPELSDEEIIKSAIEMWQSSRFKQIEFINPKCFKILERQYKVCLTDDVKHQYKLQAIQRIKDSVLKIGKKEVEERLSNKIFIAQTAARMAVADYFNTL